MLKDMSLGLKVALLLMLIAFLYLFGITFMKVPGVEFAKTIMGFMLGTVLATPIGYYWGNSSKGQPSIEAKKEEAKKDE